MADSADTPPPQNAGPENVARPEHVTPFMAQFFAAKDAHPDAIVFFRMGDFYELFFEDAEKAAGVLGITLTKRGHHKGEDIPMAGVPVHAADGYLQKLIRHGFRVAVCEQMEDPAEAKKRGSKSIVRREVTRVVTPGTITEDSLLESRAANILAAMAFAGDRAALAWADVSTGAFVVRPIRASAAGEELAALQPAELLIADSESARGAGLVEASGAALTLRPGPKADPRAGERRLKAVFEVATLEAFGDFAAEELAAMGLLLDYVELTQAGAAPRLSAPRRIEGAAFMAIDPATRASLEIERTQRGQREGSLTHALDRTVTSAGGRMLAERLARPLTDVVAINARLDAVHWFLDRDRREGVRAALRGGGDLARALQRLALGRGGPRDLGALRDGLHAGETAARAASGENAPKKVLGACASLLLGPDESRGLLPPANAPQMAPDFRRGRAELKGLADDLAVMLGPELSLLARDGGFIAPGCDDALDAARSLRDDSRRVVAGLQQTYADETGLPLKVRHNNVLGYHIDATSKQAETLAREPHVGRFIHRQTTATSTRFTTTELADLDARIARAGEEALGRELELFRAFAARASALAEPIRAAAEAIALLDVASASAEWAIEWDAVRPEIDETCALLAEGGRHPVVEQALRKQGQGFTPNDCRLDGDAQAGARLMIVTGPNMAGKSTFLRQTALLAILAQAGFFVPARRLRLGVADRVFSRVGASDDLARGRSTFMTEMVETAAILHQAGPRALVILDEIGRGTATYDGLAIAWACAEHLHDVNRSRAVFATHYHELTALADRLSGGANANLRAKEFKGDLVFLHEVAPGPADRSYGIQVAKLAGLPKSAVDRARAVLGRLESGKGGKPVDFMEAMPLFAGVAEEPETSAVEAALAEVSPDSLSPREALDLVYRLKGLLK
ncbi:MAG: DNA mismatch repair protein MutS [Caulobacteraceae bacterium]|nr:MAG: DNA mismatch repair protein MutS [Caulobacteraceae bacterium]